MYCQFCCKIGQSKKFIKMMKDEQNLVKLLINEIYTFIYIPFSLRHVTHIPSFCIANLLCFGGNFSNVTLIDAKTKYRSPYLMDISQPYLQMHISTSLGRPRDVSEGCPQGVGRTRPLELHIRPYGEVLITSAGDVLTTSVRDVPWRYIQDNMGTSLGRYIGTSSSRHISTS